MELQTKKLIAREFLLTAMLLLVGILTFFGTYIYNAIIQNKISALSKTIALKTRTADSLAKPYKLFEGAMEVYDEYGIPSRAYRLGPRSDENGLAMNGNKIFPPSARDTINYRVSLMLMAEANEISSRRNRYQADVFSFNERVTFTLQVLLISAIFLFGFRYLIYGIKWSIRTLKE